MTAYVRLYTHSGMVSAPVASYNGQKSENAVWMLRQPYLANETLTADTGAAVTSAEGQFDNANSHLLRVEVQSGKTVRIEFTPKGHDLRTATSDSPAIYGDETFAFGPGWRVSVLEAS